MCNAVIRFIEVKCIVGKAKPPAENVLKWSIKHLLFSHIQKYSRMLERECVKSYRPLQHGNGVTRFKQVESQSRNHALRGNELAVNACVGNGNFLALCIQTKASHYFIHWFDTTNFCETQQKPNDVIFNGDTV